VYFSNSMRKTPYPVGLRRRPSIVSTPAAG
jgi:hypothetical protein